MSRSFPMMIVVAAAVLSMAGRLQADAIRDAVNLVSQPQYTSYLRDGLYTHAGDDRRSGQPDHAAAQTFIYSTFDSFRPNATALDTGEHGGFTYTNVVFTIPGTVYPDRMYIVGAHYDSVNCPGADDNASGTAGVLEAARVLSQYGFQSTLVFIAFDQEETYLHGSSGYDATHTTEDIRGMISMDMIAFNHPDDAYHNKAWIASASSGETGVRDTLAQAFSTYTSIASATGIMGSSDHVPFADRGDGSALLIEYAMSGPYRNPYYHQTSDYTVDALGNPQTWTYGDKTHDYIDYAYATDMTRGVVGYLATVAGLYVVPEPASPSMIFSGAMAVLLLLRRRWMVAASTGR